MTATARSVFFYSFYLFLLGLGLAFAPNLILQTLGINPTYEIWARVLGLFSIAAGMYYFHSGRTGQHEFYRASIVGRIFFFLGMIALVLWHDADRVLILVGCIDLIGAAWTFSALRRDHA